MDLGIKIGHLQILGENLTFLQFVVFENNMELFVNSHFASRISMILSKTYIITAFVFKLGFFFLPTKKKKKGKKKKKNEFLSKMFYKITMYFKKRHITGK